MRDRQRRARGAHVPIAVKAARMTVEEIDNRRTEPAPPITITCSICGTTILLDDLTPDCQCHSCVVVQECLPRFLRTKRGRAIVRELLKPFRDE